MGFRPIQFGPIQVLNLQFTIYNLATSAMMELNRQNLTWSKISIESKLLRRGSIMQYR